MAIRYSGDVEVRMSWARKERLYHVRIRDPWRRFVPLFLKVPRISKHTSDPTSSPAYDLVALNALRRIALYLKKQRQSGLMFEISSGRIRIRRVFQAPCPVGPMRRVSNRRS